MPAKRRRRGSQPGSPPKHVSGRDSPELTTLRNAMALTVLDDAADALSDTYSFRGTRFTPARCRELILHAAQIELDRTHRG